MRQRCVICATKTDVATLMASINKVMGLPMTGTNVGKGIHMDPAACRTVNWAYAQQLQDGTFAVVFDATAESKYLPIKSDVKTFAVPAITQVDETSYADAKTLTPVTKEPA